MKNDVPIKSGLIIPEHELEITASRSGGPGGQHVNKTSTRITVRWNIKQSRALSEEQKALLLQKLSTQITNDGDILIHASASRSQDQNKKTALENLAQLIRSGLQKPKKRKMKRISKSIKEARLQAKAHRGLIKKMRRINGD